MSRLRAPLPIGFRLGTPESAVTLSTPQLNASDPMDFPRPMGAPRYWLGAEKDARYVVTPEGQAALNDPASDPERQELLAYAHSDTLEGHVRNAAQVLGFAKELGELTPADREAVHRRLVAALLLLAEGAQ